ncbi:MAG: ATP-binding cassette domain-containing protein [Candidatus Adiutrix sp.]|jgi:putative ABC transport system ATP-binding protein|nr:ATP-binding cassette domain-containing protein [Candidatus Adiutrix sp.]
MAAGADQEAGPAAGEILMRTRGLVKTRTGGSAGGYELSAPRLDLRVGERLMLTGDSGSGKSTALDMLALALKPDAAEEFIWRPESDGRTDLQAAWRARAADRLGLLRLKYMGYVPQTGGLLPFLTVRDNILLPAELKRIEKAERLERLAELGRILNIAHLWGKYPGRVSVGERQRCAIARAVIHRPLVILADEPTAALDPPTADRVFELLVELSRESALVAAAHDLGRVGRHGFREFRIECRPGGPDEPIRAVLAEKSN